MYMMKIAPFARRRLRAIAVCGAVVAALLWLPGIASACAIDNTASLYAGGVQATLNNSTPPTTGGVWASFTIGKAFASGAPVSFTESRQELARSLSAATIAAPYRWV